MRRVRRPYAAGIAPTAMGVRRTRFCLYHVATMRPDILEDMLKHPLTDSGLEQFLQDWKKVPVPALAGIA